jgi:intracellular septation protein A
MEEVLQLVISGFLKYTYPPLAGAIVVITMVIKYMIDIKKVVHMKWVTLGVTVVFGGIHLIIYESDLWRIVITMGISVIFYDYLAKPIEDRIKGKNPLKP